jgi:anionic cell wall polymer biosynthesis LytR-Cps2A-Psr (LCP) family protein
MNPLRSRGAVFAFLATLGLASVLLGATATRHFLPGHASPAEALQQLLVPSPQTVFGKQRLRVLVVGLDYDYNDRDIETSAHSRSDIIMAVKLDFARHRIYELSVPRDMVATMPGGATAKINQAQADGTLLHFQSLLDVMRRDVDTDLKANEELSLAAAFAHLDTRQIVTAQVPYVESVDLPGYGDSIVADEHAKRTLVNRMLR